MLTPLSTRGHSHAFSVCLTCKSSKKSFLSSLFLSNFQDGNFTKAGVMSKSDVKIVGQSSFVDFGEGNARYFIDCIQN